MIVKLKRLYTELKAAYEAHFHTSIHGTDATANNTAGGNVLVQGGKNKGNGVGGSVKLQTSPAGSSGGTVGTLTDRLEVDSNGVLWVNVVSTAPTVGVSGKVGLFVQGGVLKGIKGDNTVVTYTAS